MRPPVQSGHKVEDTLPRRWDSFCVMQEIENDRRKIEGVDSLDIQSSLPPKPHILSFPQSLVHSAVAACGAPPGCTHNPPTLDDQYRTWVSCAMCSLKRDDPTPEDSHQTTTILRQGGLFLHLPQ